MALLLTWNLVGVAAESVVPYASDSFISELTGQKTGFFHVEELAGRLTMVDPLGRGYTVQGVDQVGSDGWFCAKLGYAPYGRHVRVAYRDKSEWADETLNRLKSWGFNTLGVSGEIALLGRRGLAYATWLNMGGRLCQGSPEWRILPDRLGRGSLFPNVFHPDFEKECDALAEACCAPCRNDPWLIGYYIDNELGWWGYGTSANWEDYGSVFFDAVMTEEPTHSARQALVAFLDGREPTPELKLEFTRLVAERYFSVTAAAIRRHDPNHLVLGCRFAGNHAHPVVWEEAGKYCDVVTFNLYPQVDLDRDRVLDWTGHTVVEALEILYARTKKPLLVTEWSFPALDSGLPCRHGAGQRFYTQKERTRASELYARTLLSQKCCLGYNYFMWVDQPAYGLTGAQSEDSNYGLVNDKGVPYAELTDMFTRLHAESWKWRTSSPPAERAFAAADPVSEWNRFLAATSGDRGKVGFVRAGEDWCLTNSAGLSLSGRLGSSLLVERVSLDGRAFGSYGAMLRMYDAGPDRWPVATNLVDVSFVSGQKRRVGTLLLTSEGECEGARFRLVHRLFVSGGSTAFAAQIVSVENVGGRFIDLRGLFMLPPACDGQSEVLDATPNLWKGSLTRGWRLPDGATYVITSHDSSLGASFFSRDASGGCHGECEFLLPQDCRLQVGETYRPDVPMSAVLKLARAGALDASNLRYRCEVTFPGYVRDTVQTNFPALIRIPADSPFLAESAADGNDVRVTLADGTLLPHEIDHWDKHGESTLWVRLPTLKKGETKVLLHCGGTAEPPLPASDVWQGYRGVWHFSGSSADSTVNAFDGTLSPAPPTFGNLGHIGTAYTGGQGNYTVITNGELWTGFQGHTPGFTVSAWVSAVDGGYNRVLSTQPTFANREGFELCLWNSLDAYYVVGKQGHENVLSGSVSCLRNFVHLTAVFTGGSSKLYVNGVLAKQYDGWFDIDAPLTGLFIGAKANLDGFWRGAIDEVRLNFTPFASDRIAADYATQADVAFARLGELEAIGERKVDLTAFGRRCPVTFRGIGSTTLENFPALVRIPTGSSVYERCPSEEEARLLRFADASGGLLPHEIDRWNPNGESTIWVLLKRLPPTGGGATMYYDAQRETPVLPSSDVWTDYRGVWHFSGSSADSTANGFDGTDSASPPNYAAAGRIGTAFGGSGASYTVVENMDLWTGFDGHTPGFTVSAWVLATGGAYGRVVSTQPTYANYEGFELSMGQTYDHFTVIGKNGNYNFNTRQTPSSLNAFIHLTAVFQQGSNRIYVNGEPTDWHHGWMDIATPLTGLFIGAKANRDVCWQGAIDELRLKFATTDEARAKADYSVQSDATFSQLGEVEGLPGVEPGCLMIVR